MERGASNNLAEHGSVKGSLRVGRSMPTRVTSSASTPTRAFSQRRQSYWNSVSRPWVEWWTWSPSTRRSSPLSRNSLFLGMHTYLAPARFALELSGPLATLKLSALCFQCSASVPTLIDSKTLECASYPLSFPFGLLDASSLWHWPTALLRSPLRYLMDLATRGSQGLCGSSFCF